MVISLFRINLEEFRLESDSTENAMCNGARFSVILEDNSQDNHEYGDTRQNKANMSLCGQRSGTQGYFLKHMIGGS